MDTLAESYFVLAVAAKLLLFFPQKLLSKVHVNFLQFVIQPFSYFQICSSFSFN